MQDNVITVDNRIEMNRGYEKEKEYTPVVRSIKYKTTIRNGVVDMRSKYLMLQQESGSTDVLDTIRGGAIGDEVTLEIAEDPATITISNETGNLYIGSDFTMNSKKDKIKVVKAETNEWHQVSRSDNS